MFFISFHFRGLHCIAFLQTNTRCRESGSQPCPTTQAVWSISVPATVQSAAELPPFIAQVAPRSRNCKEPEQEGTSRDKENTAQRVSFEPVMR